MAAPDDTFRVAFHRVGKLPKPPQRGGIPACLPLNNKIDHNIHISSSWPVDELVSTTFQVFGPGTKCEECFIAKYSFDAEGEPIIDMEGKNTVHDLGIGPDTKDIYVTFTKESRRKKTPDPSVQPRRSPRGLDESKAAIRKEVKETEARDRAEKRKRRSRSGQQTGPQRKKPTITGTGHRLKDGMEVGTKSKVRAKGGKTTKMPGSGRRLDSSLGLSGMHDSTLAGAKGGEKFDVLSAGLIEQVNEKGSAVSELFRARLRRAEDEDVAWALVSAADGNKVTFEKAQDGGVCGGTGSTVVGLYDVTYSKGEVEGQRGSVSKQHVTIFELEEVKRALRDWKGLRKTVVDPPEDPNPRPYLFAQFMPDHFLSLVFHFRGAASSVDDMFKQACPDMDWTHLQRGGRKRELSLKAKENLAQARDQLDQIENALSKVCTVKDAEAAVNVARQFTKGTVEGLSLDPATSQLLVARAQFNAQLEKRREGEALGMGASPAEVAAAGAAASQVSEKGIKWHSAYFMIKSLNELFKVQHEGAPTGVVEDLDDDGGDDDDDGTDDGIHEEEVGEATGENGPLYTAAMGLDATIATLKKQREALREEGGGKDPCGKSQRLPLLRMELAQVYLLSGVAWSLVGERARAIERFESLEPLLRAVEPSLYPFNFFWIDSIIKTFMAMEFQSVHREGAWEGAEEDEEEARLLAEQIGHFQQLLNSILSGMEQLRKEDLLLKGGEHESTPWVVDAFNNLELIVRTAAGSEEAVAVHGVSS
jgi:hypothetical protein